jgi:hypothetical protein
MALAANINMKELFGENVVRAGAHPDTTLTIKLSDLANFSNTEIVTGEGIVLALLQKLNQAQGKEPNRVMEVTSSQSLSSRGNSPVRVQTLTTRFYTIGGIEPLDPNVV